MIQACMGLTEGKQKLPGYLAKYSLYSIVIFTLRTWAVWGRSRKIGIFLICLFVAIWVPGSVCVGYWFPTLARAFIQTSSGFGTNFSLLPMLPSVEHSCPDADRTQRMRQCHPTSRLEIGKFRSHSTVLPW
jgi:hypothetical protein